MKLVGRLKNFLLFSKSSRIIYIQNKQLTDTLNIKYDIIHWHELAMDLQVFPIPIPPPTSLSTRSLWLFPVQLASN